MPPTLLSLPIELRLKIYDYILTSSDVHSFRPQRKIGWNRPQADLSNPAALFESDTHPVLRHLFHSKLTKLDHAVILTALLHHVKVLIVDHTDFTSLQRLCGAATLPSVGLSLSAQGRGFANIVREKLRMLDFSDRLDEVVCQPGDLSKLLKGLTGLRTVYVSSKHGQRYSGSIEDHVEFARSRAEKALECLAATTLTAGSPGVEDTRDEFRRMSLRSPMTDGSRMAISPALFSSSNSGALKWVTVDLSMVVWQHFLYTGAPYRDHWRCVKMQTLIEVAEKRGLHVVMSLRNVEFDPSPNKRGGLGSGRSQHGAVWQRSSLGRACASQSGLHRGEMDTEDWILRLRHRNSGIEYSVKQRRQFDEAVSQEGCGLASCRHRRRASSICEECAEDVKV